MFFFFFFCNNSSVNVACFGDFVFVSLSSLRSRSNKPPSSAGCCDIAAVKHEDTLHHRALHLLCGTCNPLPSRLRRPSEIFAWINRMWQLLKYAYAKAWPGLGWGGVGLGGGAIWVVFAMRAMAGQSAGDLLFSEYLMVLMSRGEKIQDYALCWFSRLFRVWGNNGRGVKDEILKTVVWSDV